MSAAEGEAALNRGKADIHRSNGRTPSDRGRAGHRGGRRPIAQTRTSLGGGCAVRSADIIMAATPDQLRNAFSRRNQGAPPKTNSTLRPSAGAISRPAVDREVTLQLSSRRVPDRRGAGPLLGLERDLGRQACARTSALIRVSSRRGLVRCHCRRALRRHDQLPAAPALEPDRDADGQSVDLEAHAPGHYSTTSNARSEAARGAPPGPPAPRRGSGFRRRAASRACSAG
jgi:hypothetical protein